MFDEVVSSWLVHQLVHWLVHWLVHRLMHRLIHVLRQRSFFQINLKKVEIDNIICYNVWQLEDDSGFGAWNRK
jgi:hypothetical protein